MKRHELGRQNGHSGHSGDELERITLPVLGMNTDCIHRAESGRYDSEGNPIMLCALLEPSASHPFGPENHCMYRDCNEENCPVVTSPLSGQ